MSSEQQGRDVSVWPWALAVGISAILGGSYRWDFWIPAASLFGLYFPFRAFFRDESSASHSVGVRVNPIRWTRSFPTWPLRFALSVLALVLLAIFVHWLFWIPAVLAWVASAGYWHIINKRFLGGDANPGLVVSTDPLLVAVATDLTMGGDEYPVVKIVPETLKQVNGVPVTLQARVATIALYSASEDDDEQPYWETFHPLLLDHGTTNQDVIQRALDSFSDESWDRLIADLKEVPQPYEPGQYRVRVSESDWDELESGTSD